MKFTPTHLVTFYREPTEPTANDDGQIPEQAVEFCRRWAEIKSLSGRERILANQQQADITCRVRLLYDSTVAQITARMWLQLENGTRLNITSAFDPDMRQQYWMMDCVQRTD